MIFVIVVCLYPYLNVLAMSLNDSYNTLLGGITIYPRVFTLTTFKVMLSDNTLLQSAFITVSRVVAGTLLGVAVQFMSGYVLSKKFFGKAAITTMLLIPSYFSAGLIPTYMLYRSLHLFNNFLVYFLPSLFIFYNVMLIKVYIQSSISNSLDEATRIDGGGDWTIMTKIYLPLCKPVLAMVILFTAVGHWNDWTTTLYFVTKSYLFPLAYKLLQTIKQNQALSQAIEDAIKSGHSTAIRQTTTTQSMICAQIIITTLPIILVYPFLQKYFVNGLMLGAVKE